MSDYYLHTHGFFSLEYAQYNKTVDSVDHLFRRAELFGYNDIAWHALDTLLPVDDVRELCMQYIDPTPLIVGTLHAPARACARVSGGGRSLHHILWQIGRRQKAAHKARQKLLDTRKK
jgi:hypothetical protein